ncbi:MAG: phosphoenolpyruvate synthase [Balneolaceae bacterium]|nr:phosphoenolpyruvate synthase [Balneolaceae bacterium]MCH8548155.1 phosphoenolpyruvate synthase [Balneolaceae bacterium]
MKTQKNSFVLRFSDIRISDVPRVGGKNASLGEMIRHLSAKGVTIPDGFATTSEAYRYFLKANGLEKPIQKILDEYHQEAITLDEAGRSIRHLFMKSTFPTSLAESILNAYNELNEEFGKKRKNGSKGCPIDVAVRSSATAEDLPGASFAGQQETYLNISGAEKLMIACKNCYASLFTNRAIVYREKMGFDHMKVSLSIGVQKMVKADKSCSGVMFTVDTETGFPNAIVINGSWGLGENVVKGVVNPDQFTIFKPALVKKEHKPVIEKVLGSKEIKMIYASYEGSSTQNVPTTLEERQTFVLSDVEILKLARWGVIIENHYDRAMDIEWVKDDSTGQLFIVQARPETIHSSEENNLLKTYSLSDGSPELLLKGVSIGNTISAGKVKVVHDTTDLTGIGPETILVTEMTEPDWVPALRKAAGIVTDYGGRTCHAAIVSRELGIPAVVGTGTATKELNDGDEITISSAEGDVGKIYRSILKFEVSEFVLDEMPETKTELMLNLATPESAFKWWKLPVKGVGLARMEFIISNHIRVHPMALVHPERIDNEEEIRKIRKLAAGYSDLKQFFIDKLATGIAKITASHYPNPVIVRTSDFKSNEYAGLIGGSKFEPHEENPMLGWRGASRYYDPRYREGFELECKALKKVREQFGLDNLVVMIPFCRTVVEAERVIEILSEFGLRRGEKGLQIYMMCEIPSNVILIKEFARHFDGFSIGSNDLTQLILGVDRDSGDMAYLFDENDAAIKIAIRDVIKKAHEAGKKVGFCGQAPSDNPEYAKFLIECGIDSISVVPDTVIDVLQKIASTEKEIADTKRLHSLVKV